MNSGHRLAASRLEVLLVAAAAIVVLVAFAANVGFVVSTTRDRLLDGVEGEVLFEASRLRDGLALYVDPIRGAFDYGAVPSRYYVLYLPVWAWLLSLVPAHDAPLASRIAAAGLWFGLLGILVATSHKGRRLPALFAALFLGGTYTLTLFAAAGRPDALAVALAGLAALRTSRRARIDAVAGALFALAVCVKPNVVGLGAGMFAVDLWERRARAWPGLCGALSVVGAVVGALGLATHGACLRHLVLGTAQPLDLRLWGEQVLGRAQMMGSFVALALACGLKARSSRASRLLVGGLGSSTGWAVVCAAKIGSASNYWLEPCVGALLVFAHVPLPRVESRWRIAGAALLLVQVLWSGVASTRSCLEWRRLTAERRRALELARAGLVPMAVVIADEPGLEVALNGRLITTPFQMTHLVASGRFPVRLWLDDVSRSDVQGVVLMDDLLERPISAVDFAHDRFPPELRRRLRELYMLQAVHGGFYVYRRRDAPSRP
ncbi:MAG: hypothetical protein ABTD50_14880 [Polyangiaceae bacterium]